MNRKKDKAITKLTLILLVHLLFYFFKVNPDVFASLEYNPLPNQTYTEQPHSPVSSNYCVDIFDLHPNRSKKIAEKDIIERAAIWQSIFLVHNSQIMRQLKQQEPFNIPSLTIISFLQKQNIYHRYSEEEVLI